MNDSANNKLVLFESKQIRRVWHKDEWFYSVVDIVGVLADSTNPTDYLKKLRKRDNELGTYLGTICPQVEMITETGKKRKTLAGNTEDVLRLVQSIPSPKAEPSTLWLAKGGYERIEEMEDPERGIDRAMKTYLQKGYSKEWINQRLKTIEVRKELTDEWQERGMKEGAEYAILTNEITQAWSGKNVKEYKAFKDLKKENLRDNMSNLELVLNMLAEATTTEFSKKKKPVGLGENRQVARKGGGVAGVARKEIEKTTGESLISSKNAKELRKRLS